MPESLKKEFESIIETQGWNLSQAIRQLMHQYVAREKEFARRRAETLEALEDIQAGRIVEGDQVMAWLDRWGTENEGEPPVRNWFFHELLCKI